MKTIVKLLILLFLVGGVSSDYTSAQKWKELKKKAEQLKNKKNKSNKTTTEKKTTEKKTTEKKTTTTNNEKKTATLEALNFDPNNPVFIEYETLFKKLTLDPKTGELKFDKIKIKNLPSTQYGTRDDWHKLSAFLKLDGKVVQEFPLYGSGDGVGKWTTYDQRTVDYEKATYTVKNGGKYQLEIQVDGKPVEKIDFSIVQSINKSNNAGFFINDPLEKLGLITAHKIAFGEADPNSPLVFKFYEAILDVDKGFVDATPIDVRLMKVNPGGQDTYLGGHLGQEQSHRSKWTLTDNFFFNVPNERYKSITYKDVLDNDGEYYVDMLYNGNNFRYYFKVKDKKFLTSLSDRSTVGKCWLLRESHGLPKYEQFKPTKSLSGYADNVSMSIRKADGGSIGKGTNKPVIFTDGQFVSYSIYINDQKIKDKYMHKVTEYVMSLKKGNEIIAQNIEVGIYNGGRGSFPNVMYNPDKTVMVAKSAFSHVFMEALAKLPAGSHKLRLVWEIASGDQSDLLGARTITYNSKNGNPKMTKWAQDTKAQKLMSNKELGELQFLRAPSADWVLYENNCGRVVWLRQDEYKEYYLYPGDRGRFDRARGYIEQWNFGTLKWKSVKDFKAFKTIYKLSDNEIAMLFLKQVPKEATEKLKSIANQEFKTQEAFIAKVKSLIGAEIFEKHEDLIVQSASIDYVKICN